MVLGATTTGAGGGTRGTFVNSVPLPPTVPTSSISVSGSGARSERLPLQVLVSGVSVGCASVCTNPLDVVKTRLQLQVLTRKAGLPGTRHEGMVQVAVGIVRHEGVLALWSGLPPALVRGLFYGGLRLGLYSPVKQVLQQALPSPAKYNEGCIVERGSLRYQAISHQQAEAVALQPQLSMSSLQNSELGFAGKLLAGSLAGGLAAAVTSPTELVKTRLQAEGSLHKTSLQVIRHVIKANGTAGLWKGAVPGMMRASLLNASQCATYDEVKRSFMGLSGWKDHAGTQLACSLVTGLVTTTVTNPVDVVKTIIFVSGGRYSGALAAASDLMAREGPSAFFRGWVANYSRLGPQTVITFLVAERLRYAFGLSSL